jgi:peptidoglycan/xylan/chitin deacetylase (PgdA/CDA1 family)
MSRQLTIVMYHYVRDLVRSRYPEIKGFSLERFRRQLDYIDAHYNVIRMEDLLEATLGGGRLPERALLLTFDDAYLDHFVNVFPMLDARGLQGSFFPPAKAVLQNKMLDVNKIHFILASAPDKKRVVAEIFRQMDLARREFDLADNDLYYQDLAKPSRFDAAETIFIKRILQRDLPKRLRARIVDGLFKEFVAVDETVFAKELYMSPEQIVCLRRKGMFIGSHGFEHYFLNTLSAAEQKREIDLSLEFLRDIGCDTERWVMCYPYGEWDQQLLSVLKERRCRIGITTEVDLADLDSQDALTLPRLDANDLPSVQGGEPNEWTIKAMRKTV